MKAIARLEDPNAQILLVGDGPERLRLEREARRLGVEERVHFLGFIPHERIPAVLTHADLLEAMWVGLPIVASRTSGIPDVVTDGVNGLLPPGDSEALARTIDRVLTNEDLKRRLGEAAREQAKGYDWEVLAERILEIYRDVTTARR